MARITVVHSYSYFSDPHFLVYKFFNRWWSSVGLHSHGCHINQLFVFLVIIYVVVEAKAGGRGSLLVLLVIEGSR